MIMRWKSSVDSCGFEKLQLLLDISICLESLENNKFVEERAPALRFIRAGTRLTFTARCHKLCKSSPLGVALLHEFWRETSRAMV